MVMRQRQLFEGPLVEDRNVNSAAGAIVRLQARAVSSHTIAPACVWFTGLSGSGKTTIARALETALVTRGARPFVIDGDLVRKGLCKDLGFSTADRIENMRRIAELARLIVDGGLIALVACISPFEAERQAARGRFSPGQFLEIYVDTPLEVCETRDCKGHYARARRGEIAEFTGISSPYEAPQTPNLRLDGSGSASPETHALNALEVLAEHQSPNRRQ